MDTDFSTGWSGPAFGVKSDPTINTQHGENVENAIGDELYDTGEEYKEVDPIGGSAPSGNMPHNEMLGDD